MVGVLIGGFGCFVWFGSYWLVGWLFAWLFWFVGFEVGEMDGCGLGSHNLYWWYWGMVEGLASGTVREVCT